jgi:CBS domain-containing protein
MPQRPISSVIAKRSIVTAPATTTVREAAKQMKQRNVSSLMVVESGKLIGIFTERDALFRIIAEGRDPKTARLSEVMTAHPQTVDADKPVGFALMMMYEGGFRHVPVVRDGKPIGMISARDALGPELQEFESEIERRKRIGEILG